MSEKKKKKSKAKEKLRAGIKPADLICTTPKFRLVFPALFEPKESIFDDDAEPKYQAMMVFDKDIDLKEPEKEGGLSLKKIILNAKRGKWGKDKDEWPEDIHDPIQDGDKKVAKWGEAFEGTNYIKASSTYAPKVVSTAVRTNKKSGKRELVPITDEDEIYPGCYCRAVVRALAYEMPGGKAGVTIYLQMIQMVEDGEPLGSSSNAEAHFGIDDDAVELEDAADDDDENEDEDEKPAKKSKKKKKPKDEDEEGDEEAEDDSDDDEDEFGYSKKKKPVKKSKKKKSRDEDDDDDDD